jgi:gluconate kinase
MKQLEDKEIVFYRDKMQKKRKKNKFLYLTIEYYEIKSRKNMHKLFLFDHQFVRNWTPTW